MSDRSQRPTPPAGRTPWSLPFRVSDLAARKPTRFTHEPGAEARAALAAELGISDIPRLSFRGELSPKGRSDWHLTATLQATVVQPCVVTLTPVTTRLSEPVERRFLADMPEPEAEEMEVPEDDSAEPLPAVIDAGTVMAEALALALPPYPRAGNAELGAVQATPPGAEPIVEEKLRPFARLADLMRRDGTDGDGAGEDDAGEDPSAPGEGEPGDKPRQ
ncbi:YceD family protein [Frigidibacter oleivorans]|uniref:YceD family protein n=1 Tax=Frigidibacter oleivorans TaxID=2487129 RepID=UPI000F8DBBD1|nr:DUF177 domain-containing protein [Frigidibacter oleivorans]